MKTIRIFISSPGDVAEERDRARQVVEQLRRRYAGRFHLKALLWEDLPLQADMSFQQGIDLVLSQERGVDIAVFILWSRLGSPLGALTNKPDGSPYRSGTEREFDLMMAARRQSGTDTPKILIYTRQDEVSFDERLRGKPTDEKNNLIGQKKLLETFIHEVFHDTAGGANVRAYHSFDQPVTFSQRLRVHLQEMLDAQAGGLEGDPVWDIARSGSPFRGLEAFEFEHSPVFFGREDEVLEVRRALQKKAQEGCAFLLISGASGSGKSSLARAGVLPAVVDHEVDSTVSNWRHAICTPSQFEGDLCGGLARLLCSEGVLPELRISEDYVPILAEGLAQALKQTVDQSLRPALSRASQGKTGATRLVLLLDQLEELFTSKRLTDTDRERFVAVLEALARSGAVWVLATVRSDFYQHCQRLPALMRMKEGPGQVDLLPPAPDALRRLIEHPARLAGLYFEQRDGTSLADRILTHAAAQAELLPLVSYVLRELFEQRIPAGMLSFAAYEQLGGVEGALAKRAETVFGGLTDAAQHELSRVLRALVSVSGDEAESVVRQVVPLDTFPPDTPVRTLVDRFVAERFLVTGTPDADEDGKGAGTVAVAHEALLQVWSRAKLWIADNREFLRVRARVRAALRVWQKEEDLAGRADLLIPAGKPLEDARALLLAYEGDLTAEERGYIKASEHAAAATRRAHQRLRIIVAVFGALALVTTLVGAISAHHGKREAEANAAQSRQNLGKLYVANGVRLMDEGDLSGCLSWFVQAMKLEKDNPARTEVHRRRLDSILRRSPKLVQVFFHEDDVRCAKFSPDGLRLLTASWDNSARVWDLATGQPVTPPMKHFAGIYDAAFSPDGRRVVTGSFDRTARVWDAATGEPITPPLPHMGALSAPTFVPASGVSDGVYHVAFSPDGLRVATAGTDWTARLWNSSTGEPVAPPLMAGGPVAYVSFSPDGSRLVTASTGGTAKVWETSTGKLLLTLDLRPLQVWQAEFSTDGRFIATAANQPGEARVWDAATGRPITPPVKHSGFVTHVEFSPDGHSLVTASKDRTARVWNSETGQPVTPALRHDNSVMYASFSPDGQKVVTASVDQTVRVWDAATGDPLTPPLRHIGRVWFVAFSPDCRYLVSASDDHCARVWDLAPEELALPVAKPLERAYRASLSADGKKIVTVNSERAAQVWGTALGEQLTQQFGQAHRVSWASLSSDGRLVLTDNLDGTARIWDATTGQAMTPPVEHKNAGFFPVFSPDGSRFVTGSDSRTVQIRDAKTSEVLTAPLLHKQLVNCVSFSPDGSKLATAIGDASEPSEARIWNAITGSPTGLPLKHKEPVRTAVFSPDGRWLLTASMDKTAQVWDAITCKPVSPPLRHGAEMFSAEFSFNSRFVVTAGGDGARVWDAATSKPITPMLKHHWSVLHAGFSPDDALVVSDSKDGRVRVWDVRSGEPLTPVLGHSAAFPSTAFSPDGRLVVTSTSNRRTTACIWDVSKSERSLEDYDLLSQVLTAQVMDGTGGTSLLNLEALQSHWRKLQSNQRPAHVGSKQVGPLWHSRQAEECAAGGHWFGAVFHLKYLIDAEPQNQAVRPRYAAAQNNLGMVYLKGDGAPKDPAEAVRLFREAAGQGNAEAQKNLGRVYEDGEGVAKDLEEAARWYRIAVEGGNQTALSSLLRMYQRGEILAKNSGEVVTWLRKAAETGDVGAQSSLAKRYEQGEGVAKDPAEASKWYRKAAEGYLRTLEASRARAALGVCRT